MKTRTISLASALLLIAAGSCVELTGQRISIRHDEAKDELQILLCHDGIHESPPSRNEEGPKQIPEYVENGDILILDWPGSVKMKEMRELSTQNPSLPALGALGAAIASSVRSTPAGRYRDPDGRVGAVQLIVISHANEFFAKVNAAYNEQILKETALSESPWFWTRHRMEEGARKGQAWLSMEGHSLRFTFPAHPAEWARGKAAYVKGLLEAMQESKEGRNNDNRAGFFMQLLALSPLSLDESSEAVSIRLGNPKRPLPLRFSLRDVYNSRLEMTVAAAVQTDLDEALAQIGRAHV